MNSGLAGFAVLLIILGGISGVYLISVLGVFLIIPALLVPSRSRVPPPPRKSDSGWGVFQGSRQPAPMSAPAQAPPAPVAPAPMYSARPAPTTASQALFPGTMFPSLALSANSAPASQAPPPEAQPQPAKQDDLLETVALLAFLKVLSS
jgi:hypothetical protein